MPLSPAQLYGKRRLEKSMIGESRQKVCPCALLDFLKQLSIPQCVCSRAGHDFKEPGIRFR